MIDINELIKQAMKSKNSNELRAYRNLKSEFLKAETAKGAEPMNEAKQIQVLQKYIKTLEKSISDFSEARREDLESEYRNELEVLKKLLPEPVNEQQIYSELCSWSDNHGFTIIENEYPILQIPKKEMGSAIKFLKISFPQADGKMISDIVKEYVI